MVPLVLPSQYIYWKVRPLIDFWQARPPQWRPHHWCVAAAIATLYSAKSRQDCSLAGLTFSTFGSFLKVALSQKILENFSIANISIPNHYPGQKI
jgi:hypothetical protein